MELRMSGVGAGPALVPPTPTTVQTTVAHADDAPHPEPVAPPVTLVPMFDRNGDGKIDNTTWVEGGDAFLPVGQSVAQILDHPSPSANTPTPAPHPTAGASARYGNNGGTTVQAAGATYRRYGGLAAAQ
jgi:hypothetical protein